MCFFFNDTATTEIYTLSLHDALPISNMTATPCWSSLCGIRPAAIASLKRRQTLLPWERSSSEPRTESAASNSRRSEEHTSELQSRQYLVCRLLLEKKQKRPDSNSLSS